MPVELAAKVEPLARGPRREDGTQRTDELDHARHRLVEFGTVALLDLRADLRTKPQREAARREYLEKYSPDRNYATLMEIYRQALAAIGRSPPLETSLEPSPLAACDRAIA